MISIEPFIAEHAIELTLQPSQAAALDWHARRKLAMAYAEAAGSAFSIRETVWRVGKPVPGRLLCCCGAVERHGEHASLWALFSAGKGFAMHRILSRTRQFIRHLPHRRIDAAIVAGDAKAVRWAELCGLSYETRLAEAAPDGGDLLIYRFYPPVIPADAALAAAAGEPAPWEYR